jgi:NitT/TauT family transport system substrate-binding protein
MNDMVGARPLTVGLVARIFNNLPVWVGQRNGHFADRGLAVHAEVLGGVGAVTEALRDGRVDIAIGTPESVLSDPAPVDHPDALRIVAGNAHVLANGLIARRGIRTVGDLRGGVVGVSHVREGTALLVTQMLARHGLRPGRDFTIAAVGVAEKRWERIQAGSLDAGLQTPPHKYIAEDQRYTNLGDIIDVVPAYQFTTVNVRGGWAEAHRSELKGFLAGLSEATRRMYAEPAATIGLAAEMLGTTADYARRDYEHFTDRHSLHPGLLLSEAGMDAVCAAMTQAGTLAGDAAVRRTACIDLSYLPDR